MLHRALAALLLLWLAACSAAPETRLASIDPRIPLSDQEIRDVLVKKYGPEAAAFLFHPGGGAGAAVPGTTEVPGPSAALLASPWYTCSLNFYVNSATGNDTWDGTSPTFVSGTTGPWATIQHADSSSRTGGDCINVASGTYHNVLLVHGGTGPTATGYVSYRCSTLDACHVIANTGGHLWGIKQPANFVVIDGFEIDGNTFQADACLDTDGDTYGTGNSSHHVWALNNLIHDCALAGLSFNNKEWYYAIHNSVYRNAWTSGFQGSGIGFVVEQCIEKTAYDPVNGSHCASGGSYAGGTGTYIPSGNDLASFNSAAGIYTPFHIVIAWNDVENNRLASTGSSGGGIACGLGQTDGNGIIDDTWLDETTLTLNFPYQSLNVYNALHYNGGRGIHDFASNLITIANNTLYNNGTNQCLAQPADLSLAGATNTTVFNNLVETVQTVLFAAPLTFTNGSAVILGGNSFATNDRITLAVSGGTLPTNFATGTSYWVISTGLSSSQFELSASSGGSAIVAGSAGSGSPTATPSGCFSGGTNFCGAQNKAFVAGNGRGITNLNNLEFSNVIDGTVSLFNNDALTASFTGSITGGVMTASSVTGTLAPGEIIAGTSVPAVTYIVSDGTGSGGAGTYNLNNPALTVGSEAMTGTAGMASSANKTPSTDPLYTSVSSGTMPTANGPPATFVQGNHNFALQGASPAIGYGTTQSWSSAGAVDSGACYHTIATCPAN